MFLFLFSKSGNLSLLSTFLILLLFRYAMQGYLVDWKAESAKRYLASVFWLWSIFIQIIRQLPLTLPAALALLIPTTGANLTQKAPAVHYENLLVFLEHLLSMTLPQRLYKQQCGDILKFLTPSLIGTFIPNY